MPYTKIQSKKVSGKRVLMRVGFDMPVDARGRISDTYRIDRTIPMIRWMHKNKAITILLSHRGKPKGRRVQKLSMRPVANILQQTIHLPVHFCDLREATIKKTVAAAQPGDIIMIENLRFDAGEEKPSMAFARRIAAVADVYVNDDFSTSHRPHASMVYLPKLLPHAMGMTFQEEIAQLSKLQKKPPSPFVVIIGGGKVRDKLSVMHKFLTKADRVIVGGAAASTMLWSLGKNVGTSKIDTQVHRARVRTMARSKKIMLPIDVVVATAPNGKRKTVSIDAVPATMAAYDMGKETIASYSAVLRKAKTVFWAGPLGMYELAHYRKGTYEIARAIPRSAFSLIGGGDTTTALRGGNLASRFSFLSTGGGALLHFLAGDTLPGLQALQS